MLRNPTKNGSPEKHWKLMLAGTQNEAKMSQISVMFPPKTPNCAKKRSFFDSQFFLWFFGLCFFTFLSILGPKMAPRPKTILIMFGNFLDIFRNFSLSRLFQRFWLIPHAQDDQEQPKSMENSMEKDDQNPSQGLPKGSKSPLYGRAVAPALPAQFA